MLCKKKNGIRIYYGSYEIPVTEYKIKSHQRERSAEEKSMNKRANKEKKKKVIKIIIIHIIDLDLSSLT